MRVLFLLAGLLLPLAAACGGSSSTSDDHLHLTATDNGRTFDIGKGGEIMIVLASNASTGFSWSVVGPLPEQLTMAGEPEYVPPRAPTGVVGAPGEQVFTLEASKTGTAELRLAYARAFEPGVPPAQTFAATIIVR